MITALPIRIACNVLSRDLAVDAGTLQPPVVWAGNSARFDCALFRRDQLVADVSNLVSARMVWRDGTAQGTVLRAWDTTQIDAISLADWQAGEGQFHFTASSAETLLPLPANGQRRIYFAIEITTSATAPVTVATGRLTLREDGIGAESLPSLPPTAQVRISSAGHLELYNPDEAAWFTVTLSGVPTGINFTPSA